MRLKRFGYEGGSRLFRVFREEFGIRDETFGIYGHKPLTFSVSDAEATIKYKKTVLASVQRIISYEELERFTDLIMKKQHDFPIPDAVQHKIERAAHAIAQKVEDAIQRRKNREQALDIYIHEVTGPSLTRRAKSVLKTENQQEKIRALMYPGVAENVLPTGFFIDTLDSRHRNVAMVISARDPDGFISATVMRIGINPFLEIMGPGDRRPAKDLFAERMLQDALNFCQAFFKRESFQNAAKSIIAQKVDQRDATLPDLDRIAERYVCNVPVTYSHFAGKKLDTLPEIDIGRSFQIRYEDGRYQISHDNVVFYDSSRGAMEGHDPKQMDLLVPSIVLQGITQDPGFLSRTNIRDVMSQNNVRRPEVNEIIEGLSREGEEDNEADFYI